MCGLLLVGLLSVTAMGVPNHGSSSRPADQFRELLATLLAAGQQASADSLIRSWPDWTSLTADSETSDPVGVTSLAARTEMEAGRFDAASSILDRAIGSLLAINERNPRLVPLAVDVATCQIELGDYARAGNVLRQALAILDDLGLAAGYTAGELHMLLGISAYRNGDYRLAEEHFNTAVATLSPLAAETDANLMRARNGLASAYFELSRHDEAEAEFRRLIDLLTSIHGPDSVEVALKQHNLAEVLFEKDRLEEAEYLLNSVRRSFSQANRARDLAIVRSLVLLAKIERSNGKFVEAEQLLRQALDIQKTARGSVHPQNRYAFNVLAELYVSWERYADAIDCWQRCLDCLHSETHADAAIYMTNLGRCYSDQGLFGEAYDYYMRSLALIAPHHWRYGWTLHHLAKLNILQGQPDAAERLFGQAISIYEVDLESSHRLFSELLVDYAQLKLHQHRLLDAENTLLQALKIAIESGGDAGILTLDPRLALARLHLVQGELGAAILRSKEALTVAQRYHGSHHTEVARCLEVLSRCNLARGDLEAAVNLGCRSAEIFNEHQRHVARALDERQSIRVAGLANPGLQSACEAAIRAGTGTIVESVWDQVQRSRGLVLEEMIARRLIAREASRYDLEAIYDERQRATTDLATFAIRSDWPDNDRQLAAITTPTSRWRRLEDRVAAAEEQLARASYHIRQIVDRQRLDLTDVWTMMPAKSTLIAFYRHESADESATSTAYCVFVKRKDEWYPSVVPLGDAFEIDVLVDAWRKSLENARRYGSDFQTDDSELSRAVRAAGVALRRRIWDPVSLNLHETEIAFVVPDGSLAFVNLDALPTDDGGYVIDGSVTIHYLANERDLVPDPLTRESGCGLLILADPEFGDRDRLPTSTVSRARLAFGPLPETRKEAEGIRALWRDTTVAVLVGLDASEKRFRRLSEGRQVIHLATHGFFLASTPDPHDTETPTADIFSRNPLLLSGLALAGANQSSNRAPDLDDGIVTAAEVATLDLDGCDWVVLSACETGLGVYERSEGVLGLRRAFQQAGAKTVIMSLWKVNDRATCRWVEHLYAARLDGGLSTAAAMRAANHALLTRRRDTKIRTLPLDWGAFVATGDWR